jgi:hypothetical protein
VDDAAIHGLRNRVVVGHHESVITSAGGYVARAGVVAVGVMATALLASCAAGTGRPPATPTPDQTLVCRPLVGPSLTRQRSVDECLRLVQALNNVLSRELTGLVPAGTSITNNAFYQPNQPLGGPGLSFARNVGETGGERYEASIRIRDGRTPYNLRVELQPYDHVPGQDRCTVDDAIAKDRQAKGIVTVECGQSAVGGGTVFRSVTAYPYGSGEYAKMLLQDGIVEVYRPGGEMVRVGFDPVIEKAPTNVPTGMVAMNLSMDQLVGIASLPDLTVK